MVAIPYLIELEVRGKKILELEVPGTKKFRIRSSWNQKV